MTDQPSDVTRRGVHFSDFLIGVRQIFDLVLALLIAVLLVRTFLLQGYLISTGSMAPHYYGQQKRTVCPQCHYSFAVGTEFDADSSIETQELVTCPNCFSAESDLSGQLVNRGDHLLVWKNAYEFRDPQRWEVVVFRNPDDPLETYIKRVAGLPGELLLIRDGNLWIDGDIVQKSLEQQHALRVPLFDASFHPLADETWEPRWTTETAKTGWARSGPIWRYEPAEFDDDWLTYRQTIRFGGRHETTVCFPEEFVATLSCAFAPPESGFPFAPEPAFPGVRYESGCLIATGALSPSTFQKLSALSSAFRYRQLLQELFKKSRRVLVSDFLAYNHEIPSTQSATVQEFFLEAEIHPDQATGSVLIELQTPSVPYRCEIDLGESIATLHAPKDPELQEQARLTKPLNHVVLEMSSFDGNLLVAINGDEVFRESWMNSGEEENSRENLAVARISGTSAFTVNSLKLFRDVYYTTTSAHHGSKSPVQIPANRYFVLGDNSRVSSDSRLWETPTVPRKLLVGKPFLVHLPSTQETISWGNWRWPYRWPDFSRIRFVR